MPRLPVLLPILAWALLALSSSAPRAATLVVDFEELPLPAGVNYFNGSDFAGGYSSQGVKFSNTYTDFGSFQSWSGWAYSRETDVTTPGYTNQYSAFVPTQGGGVDGSSRYGVAYVSAYDPLPMIELPGGYRASRVRLTNTTYAALSMRDGDGFAKKFGGPTGEDGDLLRLIIEGQNAQGQVVGTVEYLLADYRNTTPNDYIIDRWAPVDLDGLGNATKLVFRMESTDVDPVLGINTPTYFALDNLELVPISVPEPGTAALLAVAMALGAGYSVRRSRRADTHDAFSRSRA